MMRVRDGDGGGGDGGSELAMQVVDARARAALE
jgi:hypothetical protein